MSLESIGLPTGASVVRRAGVRVSLRSSWLAPLAALGDFLLILACSAGMAVAYHGLVLNGGPRLGAYFAIGTFSFLNFAAIEVAGGGYSMPALLRFRRQARTAG